VGGAKLKPLNRKNVPGKAEYDILYKAAFSRRSHRREKRLKTDLMVVTANRGSGR
jgi:hypothetical protein